MFNPHSKVKLREENCFFFVIKFIHYIFVEHLLCAGHSAQHCGPMMNRTIQLQLVWIRSLVRVAGDTVSKENTNEYKLGKRYKRSK